jgi:probable F420-dependent oxidoreductase
MKIDGGIPAQLALVPAAARDLERRGYRGGWSSETNHDPFLPLALAAEHTTSLELGTCIAVAFARNPMIVANLGWDLQTYSEGRLLLGLGSQIQPHIEKRFSMPWSKPVSRMREFVMALRAIWECWQEGTKLRFEGDFYTHKIMTPVFVPEPQPHGIPKLFLAAVGEAMTEMCGEVADGLFTHGFTSAQYIREVTTPVLLRGIERSGRDRSAFEIACPIFLATGERDDEVEAAAAGVRQQIAFYGSTPAYRGVLELHGWGDLQTELHTLSLRGEWDTMQKLIDDDILDTFAVVAPIGKVAAKVRDRYDGVIDRATLYLPPNASEESVIGVLESFRD